MPSGIDFSFCLPSSGKMLNIQKMLSAFERTTKRKNRIEVLMALDEGSEDVIKRIYQESYNFRIRTFERPKTKHFVRDYYNWLADRSLGDNIIAFNDDAWIRTRNWDEKLLNVIKNIGRTVYLVDIPDTARIKYKHTFPCFPLISRRAVCTLGFLLCPQVRMYPADKITYEIYSQANLAFPCRDVLIEHEHIPESDSSKKHMMDIFKEDHDGKSHVDIGPDIYKILQVAAAEGCRKPGKIRKIIKILMEK